MTAVDLSSPPAADASAKGTSLWTEAWRRLKRNRAALVSAIVLAILAVVCVVGPFLSPHPYDQVYGNYVRVAPSLEAYPREAELRDPLERSLRRTGAALESVTAGKGVARVVLVADGDAPIREDIGRYIARSGDFRNPRTVERSPDGRRMVVETDVSQYLFLFGTDANGRDLLTRILIGGRISLAIGLLASFVAITIGVTYGAVSGFAGGRIDDAMMRFVDIMYSLPFVFFVILLVVFFGRNFVLIFIAVGAIQWLDMARIVRGQTLSIKRQEYIEAATALGVRTKDIIFRHVIPNTIGPVVIYMTLLVPRVILLESFLSFLGLGVQEPLTSWGVLISEGSRNLESASWLLIYPSIFLTATLFCLNFLGDGLRDALDPKDHH